MSASRLLVAAALAAVSIADVVLLSAYLDASAQLKKVGTELSQAKGRALAHKCMPLDLAAAPSSFTRLVNPPPMVDPALREVSGG